MDNIDEQYIFEGEYLKALTLLFLARQYNNIGEVLSKIYNSSNLEEKCIEMHWKQNTKQNTLMEIQASTPIAVAMWLFPAPFLP